MLIKALNFLKIGNASDFFLYIVNPCKFAKIINKLTGIIKEDGLNANKRVKANHLLDLTQTFDFAFTLHLMKTVLGITNELP